MTLMILILLFWVMARLGSLHNKVDALKVRLDALLRLDPEDNIDA
jgi:hypothetical protein